MAGMVALFAGTSQRLLICKHHFCSVCLVFIPFGVRCRPMEKIGHRKRSNTHLIPVSFFQAVTLFFSLDCMATAAACMASSAICKYI